MIGETELQSLHVSRHAREKEEQKEKVRRKNLLVLIYDYLNEQGYVKTAESLCYEVMFNLDQYAVCDNIDLEVIVQEFEVFHYAKFRRYPQIVKTLNEDKRIQKSNARKPGNKLRHSEQNRNDSSGNSNQEEKSQRSQELSKLCIEGTIIGSTDSKKSELSSKYINDTGLKLLRPLGAFPCYNEEWNELAKVISKDIYLENPNVKWEDIIGLNSAKNLIKEAVVYPIKYPDLFSGLLSPWKGLLLFGPPGTGKTMLAKAVATECRTTFFNISASTVISKWRGDSEKLIRVLFELAQFHAPSTIFLDELDSLMSHRGADNVNEHEASRRMKTELLIQMDGLAHSDDLVFVLAASNIPWELDHAILRRLEKRILVPLPDVNARVALFQQFLPSVVIQNKILCINSELEYYSLAKNTDGYSGADIKLVCKESVMNCLRKIFNLLEQQIQGHQLQISLEPIQTTDVLSAISRTKPSAHNFSDKHYSWEKEYGSS